MTVYKPDEPNEGERSQAYLYEGKVLGMLEADFDVDRLVEEIEGVNGARPIPT